MVYTRNYTVIKRTVFFYRTLVECVNTILELYERFDLIHLRTLAPTPPSFSRGDALNYLSVKQHHHFWFTVHCASKTSFLSNGPIGSPPLSVFCVKRVYGVSINRYSRSFKTSTCTNDLI